MYGKSCIFDYNQFCMLPDSQQKSCSQAQYEGRWTPEEHLRFIHALVAHGKNWKLIESGVETRTTSQVRSHAQKFLLKLQKLEKERKRNLKKGITGQSRSEQQLLKTLRGEELTDNTPSQIMHFLRCEVGGAQDQREEVRRRTRKVLAQMMQTNEEQSFLVTLMYSIDRFSKHSINFLERDEAFSELIDLPELHKEDEETSNKRKKSFSLYDEEDDEEKYTRMVKKMTGQ